MEPKAETTSEGVPPPLPAKAPGVSPEQAATLLKALLDSAESDPLKALLLQVIDGIRVVNTNLISLMARLGVLTPQEKKDLGLPMTKEELEACGVKPKAAEKRATA